MTINESNTNSRIWLSPPHMSGNEQEFIEEAFKHNWIAPLGPNVNGFENDIKTYLGQNIQVTVLSSGTAAIHLALILLGVKQDDEVICQTKTFVASVNPVKYLGAKPILVDSEEETWNLCPILLEKAIKDRINKGKKPKAIIAINLYGMPYKVQQIQEISNRYNIAVIEDSAEAFGSQVNNQKCGTFGDFSILSFNGNKIITTSGGGALISKNQTLKKKAVFLASQAKEDGIEYSHQTLGYNYRMSNISAGIGRGQMKVLDKHVALRRRNYEYYQKHLRAIKTIQFTQEPEGFYSNRWLSCVLVDSKETRDKLMNLLAKNNIEARPSWKPMHLQTLYKDAPSYLNGVSNKLYERGLCLPSGSNLSETDLKRITDLIISYFE
ncbi:DegT/DnrJ/EryC1/StrS aminotransferase family protein [Oceanihabitans sediminis]|uniref:Aminotransferase class V-fold PLP-dependent enzyme n=1 Tax=Oceanihabitans sediminis TaxID=1812012 RepID=A0A368P4P5_9FLAO|nr:aminotransferase class V-fold PLP-dependent enzyme [Oceanihabitans sediminis]MDX1277184.1 aminotransferase class V-fold PLP-dependent enzyme [Oceanihabitans sediminis]MDX1773602.1 aminotransferase class V-fold PLP-dependent enzyme [Oceanihabitans sediminis]RBP33046.1 dTDP-4-amino-4,6-dideoxygalactose transaminase [Oceanihabitans sediminis]RCU57438.1 aminotransferase class V-fold PLP-dependent enzyme [Oceanihabitans sediminis]